LKELEADEEEDEDCDWGVVTCKWLLFDLRGAVNVFVLKDTGDVLLTLLTAVIGTEAAEDLMSCVVGCDIKVDTLRGNIVKYIKLLFSSVCLCVVCYVHC